MQKSTDKAKQKLSESDWLNIVAEWERSGEKQSVFCKTRNITYSTFIYWHTRLKKKEKPTHKSNAFAAIKTMPTAATSAFKINLPNGIYFTVPSTFDKASLKSIFELLGLSAC